MKVLIPIVIGLSVVGCGKGNQTVKELTPEEKNDLQTDPAEETNIAKKKPELTARLAGELRAWQSSVLNSLREKDYPKK